MVAVISLVALMLLTVVLAWRIAPLRQSPPSPKLSASRSLPDQWKRYGDERQSLKPHLIPSK